MLKVPSVLKSKLFSKKILLPAQMVPPFLTNCATVALVLIPPVCGLGITVAVPPSKLKKSAVTMSDSKSKGCPRKPKALNSIYEVF